MVILVKHRAMGSPSVYVGPFADDKAAALWVIRRAAARDDTGEALIDLVRPIPVPSWGMIRLQDPADPATPDWSVA